LARPLDILARRLGGLTQVQAWAGCSIRPAGE
jgi:hypothetical protein